MKIKKIRISYDMKSFDMAAWEKAFCTIDSEKHWKDGRSAESLARFIIEHNGAEKIRIIVDSLLTRDRVVCFENAEIECECPFDSYPTPRKQDMGIWGLTSSGKKFFVGIEAKVDETFGPTVGKALSDAIQYQTKHPKSKRVDRINALCDNFGVSHNAVDDLRYQLFHYTAGTACVPNVDIRIMLTLVFKTKRYGTNLYDEKKVIRNKQDYDKFRERFFVEDCGRWQLKKCGLPSCPYAVYHSVDLD